MATIANRALAQELISRGLVPEMCRILNLRVEVDGAVAVQYEKYLSADEMLLFAEALKATAEKVTRK